VLAAFRAKYGIGAGVPVFGPYAGRLDNGGEEVLLLRPETPLGPASPEAGLVPWVVADRVVYRDEAPWPAGAVDGGGLSLQRQGNNSSYGNEALSWRASTPTPGAANGTGVVPAPVITGSPQSQSVLEGSTAALSVAATGNGPLAYQWRFNGLAVPEATNAVYGLDYVVTEDEGRYDCLVSNPGGVAVSTAAQLTVRVPAQVLIAPVGVTNRVGSNVVFSVSARGSAPLRYQWRFNGLALPGETNASLVRTNIQLADDGEYDVVVSNPVSSTIASARLVVLINTTITLPPMSVTVVTGATFTVSVAATGNPLPFGYEWRQLSSTVSSNTLNSKVQFISFRAPTNFVVNQSWRVVVRNLANQSLTANAQFFVTTVADTDGDGLPDPWESQFNFNSASNADRNLDADGDGASNWEEYQAGTDPTNALSRLSLSLSGLPGGPAALSFPAVSNFTYSVQFSDLSAGGSWSNLADVFMRASNRTETVTDPTPVSRRFYRVVTPKQP
jgi:hypothetical protein